MENSRNPLEKAPSRVGRRKINSFRRAVQNRSSQKFGEPDEAGRLLTRYEHNGVQVNVIISIDDAFGRCFIVETHAEDYEGTYKIETEHNYVWFPDEQVLGFSQSVTVKGADGEEIPSIFDVNMYKMTTNEFDRLTDQINYDEVTSGINDFDCYRMDEVMRILNSLTPDRLIRTSH